MSICPDELKTGNRKFYVGAGADSDEDNSAKNKDLRETLEKSLMAAGDQ